MIILQVKQVSIPMALSLSSKAALREINVELPPLCESIVVQAAGLDGRTVGWVGMGDFLENPAGFTMKYHENRWNFTIFWNRGGSCYPLNGEQ